MLLALRPWLYGSPPDTTPPTIAITVDPSRSRISHQPGKTTATLSFAADEDYRAYEVRVATSETSPRTGVLLKSGGGGVGNSARQVDVTASDWVAAGLAEETLRFKIFGQDLAGNWSA